MTANILKIFVIFGSILILMAAKNNVRVDIESVTCYHFAPKYLSAFNCSIRRDRDNITKLSAAFNLIKQLDDLDVRFVLDILRKKRTSNVRIFDLKLNVCEYLTTQQRPLLDILKRKLRKILNAELKCPLIAPYNYTITDYFVSTDLLPKNFPAARAKMFMQFYYKKKLYAKLNAIASVIN